jgi:hypothetical protein
MGPHASSLTESKGKPHVVNQRGCADRRVEKDARESEDEYVEELFGPGWFPDQIRLGLLILPPGRVASSG